MEKRIVILKESVSELQKQKTDISDFVSASSACEQSGWSKTVMPNSLSNMIRVQPTMVSGVGVIRKKYRAIPRAEK